MDFFQLEQVPRHVQKRALDEQCTATEARSSRFLEGDTGQHAGGDDALDPQGQCHLLAGFNKTSPQDFGYRPRQCAEKQISLGIYLPSRNQGEHLGVCILKAGPNIRSLFPLSSTCVLVGRLYVGADGRETTAFDEMW